MKQSEVKKLKYCILLTATIDPGNMVFVQRKEPQVRENDYINSLKLWLKKDIPSLVFCENSKYNSEKIKDLLKSQTSIKTEYIEFNGQLFSKELGKGYGELNTIRHALQNSLIINNSELVIKISGRYFIKNIQKITDFIAKEDDTCVMADMQRNLTWADSRVFAFKPSFFLNYLSNYQNLLDDSKGFYFEHALARAVLSSIKDGYKWLPLPFKPIIVGNYGTIDSPYSTFRMRLYAGEVIHRLKNYLNRR